MDIWKVALKSGRPVAVIALVIYLLSIGFFKDAVIKSFSNEQQFAVVLIVVAGLLIALITAVIVFRKRVAPPSVTHNNVTIQNNKVKGDIVAGDKYVDSGKKK